MRVKIINVLDMEAPLYDKRFDDGDYVEIQLGVNITVQIRQGRERNTIDVRTNEGGIEIVPRSSNVIIARAVPR